MAEGDTDTVVISVTMIFKKLKPRMSPFSSPFRVLVMSAEIAFIVFCVGGSEGSAVL